MSNEISNCSLNGVSRRSFLRTLGAAGAAAAAIPAFAQQQAMPAPAAAGQGRRGFGGGGGADMGDTRVLDPNTVIISSNENRLGPRRRRFRRSPRRPAWAAATTRSRARRLRLPTTISSA